MDLLCFVLSCVCNAFVPVCLYMPCGHLLGKGWPLGSRLWCLTNIFSAQFIKIISHYKKIGYNINVLQQTACLVVNPITVGNFAFLFNCTPVGRTSDSMMVPT